MPRKLVGFNIRYKGDRPPTHEDFKTLLEIARDADKHYDEGLYYLAVPEFFARRDPNRLHSVPYLAAIATVTENVRFGPNVMEVPLLHPKHVADISASLDIMSNGRFILGVGVGWIEEEYENFGVSWKERGKICDESLEIIKRLWTEPVVNYTGKYFKIVNDCSPPCIQKPHVPIWVGGGSKAARRRAAQYGNDWAPSWWFPGMAEEGDVQALGKIRSWKTHGMERGFSWQSALEELRMYCEKFGRILVLGRPPRDPKEVGFNISGFNININPDMEAAVEEAKYFWTDVRKGRTQGGGSLEMKLKYAAVGKPEEVVEKLNEAYKIGAYCVVLYPLSTNLKAQWERVKEILPSL